MIPIVYHADYRTAAPPGGRYRWGKNGLVRDLLEACGASIDWLEPQAMARAAIEAVHDPGYVAEVMAAQVPAAKERRIGFSVDAVAARRALRVPGGTHLAARIALDRGFAANIAGGSHHALAETGAGYCVFNDLAIAAVALAGSGDVGPILIVDCDVHQGDGTAVLTAGRPGIATYSIHAEKNFPARKARSTLDVALPDGTGDEAYLAALETSLVPMVDALRPALILYQAGVDPFVGDRLGRLALSQDGLDARDRFVVGFARRRGIALASTLGGGYGSDMMEVARRHVRSVLVQAEAAGFAARAGLNSLGLAQVAV